MSLTNEGKQAVAQLAAQFVFDDETGALQQELAQRIETALAEFKYAQLQAVVARELRKAIERSIVDAIEAWHREHSAPQPVREDVP